METVMISLTLENVLYEKKGAVAYITLNRPKELNALNQRTWEELRSAFEDARDDAEVRGIIVTGAGDKAFAAGEHIRALGTTNACETKKSRRERPGVIKL